MDILNQSKLEQKGVKIKMHKEVVLNAFNYRHACKEFEANQKIAKEDFDFILETARLSPFG